MNEHRKYCRQVKKWIPVGGKFKKQLMSKISSSIQAFLSDNPKATYQQILERFGSPQQIAASYVDEMDMQQLLNALFIHKRITRIIMISATIALAILLLTMVLIYIEAASSFNGYFDVAII